MAEPGTARPVVIVGLHGGQWYGAAAGDALRGADVLIGAARQFELLPGAREIAGERLELWGPLDQVLDTASARADGGERVVILAAGDPGFFGLVRLARHRLAPRPVVVHPAPSSVSLAFARLAMTWDDANVVSAHGRPIEHAVDAVLHAAKVAVLVSRDQPPEALGCRLVDAGCGAREVAVCSRLGEPEETVWRGDLAGLANGTFDPLSVVVFTAPEAHADRGMGLAWGLDRGTFDHRAGMITKDEVRAVALGKLSLPPAGVLWDVGAGSGSVAVEAARLAPGLRVFAIERRDDDVARIHANAHGTGITVVHGDAPRALGDLPDPDRAFVGGGGTAVLDAVVARLRSGGAVVSTHATVDGAAAAWRRLGNMVQISVSRAAAIGSEPNVRLDAENPVFVCWGPAQ